MRTNWYAAQVDFYKRFVVLFLKCNLNFIAFHLIQWVIPMGFPCLCLFKDPN